MIRADAILSRRLGAIEGFVGSTEKFILILNMGELARGGGRNASASSSVAARNSRAGRSSHGSGAGSGSLEGSSGDIDDERDALASGDSGAAGASGGGDSRDDARDRTHKRGDEEGDDRSLFENQPMGEELEEADPAINMLVSGIVGLVVLALAVIGRFAMVDGRR